jgi:HSP20 family protein
MNAFQGKGNPHCRRSGHERRPIMLPVAKVDSPLVRHRPANRLSSLIERLFGVDEFFPSMPMVSMPLSVWEDDAKVHLEVDAPGLTEKDIEVTVLEGDLIIRGERKVEKKENGYDTRSYGRFEERVRLPAAVDSTRVEAKLVKGVLSIDLPKAPEARPHKVEIKGE